MKFFNLDLHISVIADVKDILNTLYPSIEIVDWSISGHIWVMNKTSNNVKIINENTWQSINKELICLFHKQYDEFLSQFDGFIVTHTPVFALLYEKYNKPIIMINSCRYEQPYCWTYNKNMLNYLEERLSIMHKNKQLIAISNNLADQKYINYGTGIVSEHIPSLCLYTKSTYTNKINMFIIKGSHILKNIKNTIYLENILPVGYKWEQLYSFKGIIHIPYEISTMSIFEQYSANVPLIFPSKNLLKKLIREKSIPFNGPYIKTNTKIYTDVINKMKDSIDEKKWVDFWIDKADYYDEENMKYITYFDSIEELPKVLENIDTELISKQMKEWNKIRQQKVYDKWNNIIKEIKNGISI